MITWEQLRSWRPEPVAAAADDVTTARNNLVRCQTALDASEVRDWRGVAADKASKDLAGQRQDLEKLAAELGALAKMLDVSESDIGKLQRGVEEADALASVNEFRIEGDAVVDASNGTAESFMRPLIKAVLTARVAALLDAAKDIDQDLHQLFYAVMNGGIKDGKAADLADAAREGAKSIEMAEILEDYQTGEEKIVTASVLGMKEELTETEAKMLLGLSLNQLATMYAIREGSGKVAAQHYPEFRQEGQEYEVVDRTRANAFKHAYWNAMMVREYGPEWAEKYATAHEAKPNTDPNNEAMDLYNNEVGRKIATANPNASPEEIARLIQQAERNGELVYLGENGQLKYTNER